MLYEVITDPGPVPHQAATVGLQWVSAADPLQRGISLRGRAVAPFPETSRPAGSELFAILYLLFIVPIFTHIKN